MTHNSNSVTIEFDRSDILVARAALGEVCYALNVPDFENALGGSETEARLLFERFDRLVVEGVISLKLTHRELCMITSVVDQTLRALGPEEFFTRTGVDFELGQAVHARLKKACDTSG